MNGNGRDRRIDSDAEWAREVQRRLDALDRPQSIRIGDWVIAARDGELVATAPGRDAVTLTLPPSDKSSSDSAVRVMRVVSIVGSPSSGTWGLLYRGVPTINTLNRNNATATQILSALLALDPRYTTLDFNVAGPNGGPWTVTTPPGSLDGDGTLLAGGTNPGVSIQPL